jgi:hypothetical protein
MAFIQDTKSKKFVEQVKTLVNKGVEPTYKAIAEKIGWHNNSLSVTMKGGRNVPFDVYKKFLEVYKLEEENEKKADSEESAYKDKYIALLEQQIKDQTRQLAELKERVDARTLQLQDQINKVTANLAVHDQTAKTALAYCKTLYQCLQEHFARVEKDRTQPVNKKNLEAVQNDMDTRLAQQLAEAFQ